MQSVEADSRHSLSGNCPEQPEHLVGLEDEWREMGWKEEQVSGDEALTGPG